MGALQNHCFSSKSSHIPSGESWELGSQVLSIGVSGDITCAVVEEVSEQDHLDAVCSDTPHLQRDSLGGSPQSRDVASEALSDQRVVPPPQRKKHSSPGTPRDLPELST